MSDLEQIVRPSETGDVRPGRSIGLRKAPAAPVSNEIVWGAAGNTIFQLQQNLKAEVPKPIEEEEIERTVDTVRVKSKDDPDTFIDVEVMTRYQARNTIDKQRVQLKFHPPEADENTEIIRRGEVRKSGG